MYAYLVYAIVIFALAGIMVLVLNAQNAALLAK